MFNFIRRDIASISTDELYRSTLRSGHEFLRLIRDTAQSVGITILLAEINLPLLISELIIVLGGRVLSPEQQKELYTAAGKALKPRRTGVFLRRHELIVN